MAAQVERRRLRALETAKRVVEVDNAESIWRREERGRRAFGFCVFIYLSTYLCFLYGTLTLLLIFSAAS